jgi:peptidoglycan/LPS O-acetylase OafA/YrhL
VGLLPHFAGWNIDLAAPWFLGVFALGMVGAQLSGDLAWASRTVRWPWGILAWSGVGCYFLLMAWGMVSRQKYPNWPFLWPVDVLVGLTTVCFLVDCTRFCQRQEASRLPLALRVFGSRPAVALGVFSYSLYLTHAPVLGVFDLWLHARGVTGARLTLYMLAVAVPMCLVVALAFHYAIERRFMPGAPRTEKEAAPSAVMSPAP